MSLGFTEIVLIIIVILLLFGAKRIPELAKAIGRASHEYKKAKELIKKESEEIIEVTEKHAEAEDKKTAAAATTEEKSDTEKNA